MLQYLERLGKYQIQELGSGSFGSVQLAIEKLYRRLVAIKKMDYITNEQKEMVDKEVKIMRDICDKMRQSISQQQYQQSSSSSSHQNSSQFLHVVEPLGFFKSDDGYIAYLVLEYCEGGDLHHYIKDMKDKGTEISEKKSWEMFEQIGFALQQLHINGIVHSDLKPSNILLTKDNRIKIGDFGLARQLRKDRDYTTQLGGTKIYQAPELLIAEEDQLKKRQTKSADIWACGVMLFELLTHQHPFSHGEKRTPSFELMHRVLHDEPDEIPIHYPESMRNLVKRMLNKDPEQRITADEFVDAINKIQNEKEKVKEKEKGNIIEQYGYEIQQEQDLVYEQEELIFDNQKSQGTDNGNEDIEDQNKEQNEQQTQ
ncbi:MAG: putative Serine/threonine protein kinase [Streblomastix strix]|uniref:non-specific serine/threonine protein kinase n=1 Tax=Streblomastix strix TaxID=222440 RepID=A0A5J4VHK8_9EUKA|nr:MAG: putative Serine/threonine protein kinase [Streblomastix strix]